MIFEDDAWFEMPFDSGKIKKILKWLEKNDLCEILYFGSLSFLTYPVNSYILRAYKPYLIHCYCLNRVGMKKILDNVDGERDGRSICQYSQFGKIWGLPEYQ